MPMHDWTRVDAGIYHDFHNGWGLEIRTALNNGLLPKSYYALSEQHTSSYIPDVLTLHSSNMNDPWLPPTSNEEGGVAVAEVVPKVRRTLESDISLLRRRRTISIRHISGHRLVAMIEIVSPGNKDRAEHVLQLVNKAVDAIGHGIHLLVVDPFAPGRHDPQGIAGAIWFSICGEELEVPIEEPFSLASFQVNGNTKLYLEHLALGKPIPQMPLFFLPDRYIQIPLEETYQMAFRGIPRFWKEVLERPTET